MIETEQPLSFFDYLSQPYYSLKAYWLSEQHQETDDLQSLSSLNSPIKETENPSEEEDPGPPNRIKRFAAFVKRRYPESTVPETTLKRNFYKIHRQLVVNPRFRGKRIDWDFLAAKFLGLAMVPEDEKNERLWSELTEVVRLVDTKHS